MSSTLDPALPIIVILIFIIIFVTILLKTLNQPNVIAYIIAGFLIGPYGFEFPVAHGNQALGRRSALCKQTYHTARACGRQLPVGWELRG